MMSSSYITYTEDELSSEVWKDIIGYEGLYQVSNLGRVRSYDKVIKMSDGRVRHDKGRLLKTSIVRNYKCITLYHNNKSKSFKIHRLVATAFIPNPYDLPQVNHIDEDKLNNRIENLEWVTALENNKHSNIANRWHSCGTEASKKPVLQYDLLGNLVAEYESASEAARKIGKLQGRSSICKCCNGTQKKYLNSLWRWKYE